MTDEEYWQLAREVCSERQLEALELRLRHEFSYRTIALQLGISQERARQLVERALQKIVERQRGGDVG